MRRIGLTISLLLAATSASAKEKPQPSAPNMLTTGMVNLTLRVGETTQAQIIETFGAPNITTLDATGSEMWVYDRQATVSSDSSGGFSIGLGLGGGGGDVVGAGGLGFGSRKSKSETTQRSMTLIIKFDNRKIVSDFKSRSSSF